MRKKKDIKILSETIENNFFTTFNKIKRLDEGVISESDVPLRKLMLSLQNKPLCGGFFLNWTRTPNSVIITLTQENAGDYMGSIEYSTDTGKWDLSKVNAETITDEDKIQLENIGRVVQDTYATESI
tara:strand:- start:237 stop:617 length:381 start_codon:yes stop_codon:yes gene_type:complete